MTTQQHPITKEILKLHKKLEQKKGLIGLNQSLDISEIEETLLKLKEKIEQENLPSNWEARKMLDDVQKLYMKISANKTGFESALNQFRQESNDNEADFESYLDAIHYEP